MTAMHDHNDELARLKRSRNELDRMYKDAMTALDSAVTERPECPQPPPGFDDQQIHALNESWRLVPDGDPDLGTGWRRRLRGIRRWLIGPMLQRQQRFNALLVEHLNRNVRGARASPESVAGVIVVLNRHLEALAVFQHLLLQYLQQITLYVDAKAKDGHEAGRLGREVGEALTGMDDRVRILQAEVDKHAVEQAEIRNLADCVRNLQKEIDERAAEQQGLRQSVELVTAATHAMKREVERLCEAPSDSAPPGGADGGRSQLAAPDLDAYKYLAFEDQFRGSREQIAAGQRAYLPHFDGAADVLDLGCGRGEFLDLLRKAGITARGLDVNVEAVELCREQGFDVTHADALEYLRELTDESLGGLFSAQVVEHLEAEHLTRLLAEACRVLRPGSRIVLETLNPACWTAFFSAFVRDITHRHPLHPDTLHYFLRASGFVDIEIVYCSPVPDAGKLQRAMVINAAPADTPMGAAVRALTETFNQHVDQLNSLIFAEQDYAAIARRP